jgi:type I restriction enzyme S subunit
MRQSPLVRNVRPSKIPEESTDVILSIKPKYVQSILSGEKRYEFRKAIFKNRTIDRVFIYSSAPVKRIVALFEIGTILEDHPAQLWDAVREYAGIDDSEFFSYFAGKSRGYAIGISDLQEFDEPIDPKVVILGFVPPQSYCYVDGGKCITLQ